MALACHVFHILTWKCASRYSRVPFFDSWTPKSGPVFCTFDVQMWFAPQRRAIFRHLNFQKWAKTVSFLAFWLANVLRATAACHFSCLLWSATSAPAALASLLFDPADPQIIAKTQRFATCLTFARVDLLSDFRAIVSSFFWLYFSSLLFIFWLYCSALLFQLSILSEATLLNFLWQTIITGSLAEKLPIYERHHREKNREEQKDRRAKTRRVKNRREKTSRVRTSRVKNSCSVILCGRRTIWWSWSDVGASLFVAGTIFGEVDLMFACHSSWQLQYLVKLQFHFSWQAKSLLARTPWGMGITRQRNRDPVVSQPPEWP